MPWWSVWQPLLPGSLITLLSGRMMSDKVRDYVRELTNPWSPTRWFMVAIWTLGDLAFFWLPRWFFDLDSPEWDERLGPRSDTSRPSPPRHEHAMRLDRHESAIYASCDGCGLSVPVKPPRRAQRNVVLLERWLDRLESRVARDM